MLDALGEFLEAGDRSLEERPERRRVDLLPRVGVDLHFLPRAAERFALHARPAAVGFDFVDVVERLEAQVGDQLVALERFLRGAELQLHQPAFAGDRVEEPAVGFFRRRDFDDRAVVPIRRRELAQLVNASLDRVENAAVPLARLGRRGRRDLFVCQPRPSTSHGIRVSRPTSSMSRSSALRRDGRFGIVRLALDERPGGEHGREGDGGVGDKCGVRSAECGVRRFAFCFFIPRSPLPIPHSTICSGVPHATTCPPSAPASGPRSMTQSAVLMTSRLCSMTTTVLP